MPRVYKKKLLKRAVDNDSINECLEYMRANQCSLNSAATTFNIPESTLRYHNKRQMSDMPLQPIGHRSSLPTQVEVDLAVLVRTSSRHGFPLSKEDVRALVGNFVEQQIINDTEVGRYLKDNCVFKMHVPSLDWVTEFMRRHHLSLHKPSTLERTRYQAASNPFTIYHFYDILECLYSQLNIVTNPSAIYNLDETSFCTDPQAGLAIGAIGSHSRRVISGSGRSCFTALACICADGTALPPMIIFAAKNFWTGWRGDKDIANTQYGHSGNVICLPVLTSKSIIAMISK
jgi:hypothetical protein